MTEKKSPKPVSPNVSRVILYDPENRRSMYLDPVDGGVVPTIKTEHSMIHREKFFTATIEDDNLKPSKSKLVYLKTSESVEEAHIRGSITATKPVYISFSENPLITSLGSPVKTFNSNRNSDKTPQLRIYEDPVVDDYGETIRSVHVASEYKLENEFILKKDAGYLAKIEPAKKNTAVTLSFEWYEASTDY